MSWLGVSVLIALLGLAINTGFFMLDTIGDFPTAIDMAQLIEFSMASVGLLACIYTMIDLISRFEIMTSKGIKLLLVGIVAWFVIAVVWFKVLA
jgi:hypothetical protein